MSPATPLVSAAPLVVQRGRIALCQKETPRQLEGHSEEWMDGLCFVSIRSYWSTAAGKAEDEEAVGGGSGWEIYTSTP